MRCIDLIKRAEHTSGDEHGQAKCNKNKRARTAF